MIEEGLENADYMAVVVTADIKRKQSFVRLEIAYALSKSIPIIPLKFPGGHLPLTIISHTYIDFADWDTGFAALLARLHGGAAPDTSTLRSRYLQEIGQRYDRWRYLYTDLAASPDLTPALRPECRVFTDARRVSRVSVPVTPVWVRQTNSKAQCPCW